MAKYIIHKAVEFSKLSKKMQSSINLDECDWQPKFDGCNMVATVSSDGVSLRSRTNHVVKSANHIAQELKALPLGVYLGEFILPGKPFPESSGAFRNENQCPEAMFIIFDHLSNTEWGASAPDLVPVWGVRRERLKLLYRQKHTLICPTGTKREMLKYIHDNPQFHYDGLIARRRDGGYQVGAGTGGEIIKVKNLTSLDLRLVGYNASIGDKTGREVYTMRCAYNGVEVLVGSGVPHKQEDLPLPGSIVEIEALGFTPGGALREPRFNGVRHDKLLPDC